MWRLPFQAPPPVQSWGLGALTQRTFDLPLPERFGQVIPAQFYPPYVHPPFAQNPANLGALAVRTVFDLPVYEAYGLIPPVQFYPAWIQPPQPQGAAAILSAPVVVTTPLAPPFGATVLGRVEQFYPPWVKPPAAQDPNVLASLGLAHSPPLFFISYGNVPPPPWVQPPPVQGVAAILSKLAAVTVVSPPFTFAAYGNVPPAPWVKPPALQQFLTSLVGGSPAIPNTPPDSGYLGGMPASGGKKKKRHPMDWPPRYIIEAKKQQAQFEKMAVPGPLPLPPDPRADRRRRDMDALMAILAIMDD